MAGSLPTASGRIFISYRREETAYPAGWLYDRLADRYGGGQVFKDVDSLQLGDDFEASGGGEPGVTYRLEHVRCGKPNCGSCPHGPYWYAYYREGNRLKSRYIGRELPQGAQAPEGEIEPIE